MPLLTATRVGKAFGADDIFDGITVDIPEGARIAMVGPNGAGKTTLLRILIRTEDAREGFVHQARGLSVGYLPQRPELLGNRTLWDEMLTAFAPLQRKEAELSELAHKMAEPDRRDAEEIIERYGHLQEAFELAGGYNYETRIQQGLQGLGFDADDYGQKLTILSGGQQTPAPFSRLQLARPDFLGLHQ